MKVVNILEIADVNEALLNAGVPARVRLRDACGGQSLWVEVSREAVAEKDDAVVLAAAREVVSARGRELVFCRAREARCVRR